MTHGRGPNSILADSPAARPGGQGKLGAVLRTVSAPAFAVRAKPERRSARRGGSGPGYFHQQTSQGDGKFRTRSRAGAVSHLAFSGDDQRHPGLDAAEAKSDCRHGAEQPVHGADRAVGDGGTEPRLEPISSPAGDAVRDEKDKSVERAKNVGLFRAADFARAAGVGSGRRTWAERERGLYQCAPGIGKNPRFAPGARCRVASDGRTEWTNMISICPN